MIVYASPPPPPPLPPISVSMFDQDRPECQLGMGEPHNGPTRVRESTMKTGPWEFLETKRYDRKCKCFIDLHVESQIKHPDVLF